MANFSTKKKQLLDEMLERNKVTIVGIGYIDLIVPRENYKNLLYELIWNDFIISDISWWEYCVDTGSKYWLGWPRNHYWIGWYSEITIGPDTITIESIEWDKEKGKVINEIINFIEKKEIKFYWNEYINFQDYERLTPAFWLKTPEGWKNIQ